MLGRRLFFPIREIMFPGNQMNNSSDGTLNPNGIRFGSAEIYSIVDQFNGEIFDSLCVAQRNPTTDHERVILFLKVSEATQERRRWILLFEYMMLTRREKRHV